MLIATYLLAWLLLAAVAVANGIVRQATYGRFLPELAAHQVSTVTGVIATGIAAWFVHRSWPLGSPGQALSIGAVWLLLTIAFEFGFGHFVAGHSWERLLTDYNILRGRLWSLFLIWIAILPYVVFRLAA